MKLGDYVRLNRRHLGITQDDLAQRLNMARTTVVAIEAGQRKLRANELMALREIGFPEPDSDMDVTSEIVDKGWMTVSEDERRLIKAYRSGSLETIIRLTLAYKDRCDEEYALPFDEVTS